MMSKRIVIIGGGIVGLCTAWYCCQRGHHVTVIERQGRRRDGCSFGNAGLIVPSHFVPLAAPGMIRLGLKWMWNPQSPFYIRPRVSWDLLSWLWRFQSASTWRHVRQAAPLLRDLHLASRQCYCELESEIPGGFGLQQNGLLMLCRSKAMLHEETETAQAATRLGVDAQVLGRDETAEFDGGIEMDVSGSVYYPRDCCLSPDRLMDALQVELIHRGCEFRWQTNWTGFATQQDRIRSVETSTGTVEADEVVVCGGVWSSSIAKRLGLSLPIQAGKGYSVTLDPARQQPKFCSILTEARVAVTPIDQSVRFAGTMEIAGLDESISSQRVRGIVRSIPNYFPQFKVEDFAACEPWCGLRPCSPDGLPYLGRTSRWDNLVISTGHAMLGISLAMISGRIASQIIGGLPTSIPNLELLSPDRYHAG
jgi:D-amino-acid dehydrogenase